ncbi:hypothetical protein ACF0H5_009323 [Mactra antiquata]
MAEGGFDNPVYDPDDYGDDKDDYDDEEETSFITREPYQLSFYDRYVTLDKYIGSDREKEEKSLLETMTKGFYDRNQEAVRKITPILKSDNLDGVKDYQLSFYNTEVPMAPIQYYALDTLQKKIQN